ncbi:MAG TPA: immunoglobulin domain-containing protein, partial [Candidatus Didemnitutus sp.]
MATAISADPTGIAVSGNHIYTTSSGPSTNVVVYNATTGAIINSDLITGLSNPAGIAVVGPVITSQPASVAAPSGGTATFNAAASGTGAITFQWYFNGTALTDGTNIAGRPTATLVLSDLQSSENGTFTVVA